MKKEKLKSYIDLQLYVRRLFTQKQSYATLYPPLSRVSQYRHCQQYDIKAGF